jgi:hypothetical protein
MSFFFGKAFDYNDFVKQVRGFCQGHPQVLKSNVKDPQSGITFTGTGAGELFVSTESFTPAGNPGSPAGSPGPGTLYRLVCTVAGNETTSPLAQFDVFQEPDTISPSYLGTMTVGVRWKPDGDVDPITSPEITSPVGTRSPQHGLELALNTTTDWVVSDTIEFRLVDHFIGRDANDNFIEQRYVESDEDVNGDFNTEWIFRAPSIANATGSPITPFYGGIRSTFNDTDSEYNVGLMGANDYEPSSNFQSQPNTSGRRYAYLSKNPFPFWLVCNADGFYVASRSGSVYEHMTIQLMDVFATGNQHPLPMFVGAMSETNDNNATQTLNDQHAAWWDAGVTSSARFRWVDGTWYNVENRSAGYGKSVVPTRMVAPWKSFVNSAATDGNFNESDYSFNRWSHQMLARYDGSYELFPATLIITDPQQAVVGDLKFIKYVTGNGLNAEDTTTDNSVSPQIEYIAFQNAQLSDNDNFCVMELLEG